MTAIERSALLDRSEGAISRSGVIIVATGAVAVFVLALLGVEMTRAAGNVASIWLANVVALGVILRVRGLLRLIAFFASGIAIFAANAAYGDSTIISLGLTGANLLEIGAVAVVFSLLRFDRSQLLEPAGFMQFVLVAGLLGPILGAIAGASVLQVMVGAPYAAVFPTWVMSGILGAIIIGPSVVAPLTFELDKKPLARWEILTWSAASAGLVFLTTQSGLDFLIYLAPALVIFSGIRLGMTASGFVGAALSIFVAWDVVTGVAGLPFSDKLIEAQVFLMSSIFASHIVALLWHKRSAAETQMAKYVQAVESANEGILILDAEDRFDVWNAAMEQLLPEAGQVPAAGREQFRAENLRIIARLRKGERIVDLPMQRPLADGKTVDLLVSAAPIFADGVYHGAALTFRDVTQATALQEAVESRAKELEAFIEATSDAVVGTNQDGIINIWNKTASKFYGIDAAEAVGRAVYDLQGGLARDQRDANMKDLREGQSVRRQIAVRSLDTDTERQVELAINPIFDRRGTFTGSAAVLRDLTPLFLVLSEKDTAENHLANALSAITDAVAIFGPDEIMLQCNEAYAGLVGDRPAADLIGDGWVDILQRNVDRGEIELGEQPWEEWIAQRRAFRQETVNSFVLSLRGDRWLLAKDYPIPNGGFVSVRQDITELKRTEAALAFSNNELEQFAFVASHDLQEPLRKIHAFGSILEEEHAEEMSDEARTYLKFMIKGADRMQNLIQDLLSYSRIQDNTDSAKHCDLADLAHAAVDNLSVAIEQSGADIRIGNLGKAFVHPGDITRVFQNLILNSIKYRKEDIPPMIEVTGQPLTEGYLKVKVSDNGIGFDARFTEQIMEPFKRLHSQSQIPGTGMGLAIVAKIIRNHSGSISVHGEVGVGATFDLVLPRTPK